MKIAAILSVFILMLSNVIGQNNTTFNHLSSINKEWFKHADYGFSSDEQPRTDREWIQYHLRLVSHYLESHTSNNLTSDQRANRSELIGVLKGYAEEGIFPTNHYHAERRPYFVDNYGVHCAVGYLMKASGSTDLVAQIRKEHNYDYIREIKTPGVIEWAEVNGFTVDELAWIQPGYQPSPNITKVQEGMNGPVTELKGNSMNGGVIMAGAFDSLNNLPCLNIGQYLNDQLACLGQGIDGTINDLEVDHSGKIVVFGSFPYNGESYPIAKFDYTIGTWSYIEIVGFSGAIATAGTTNSVGGAEYIVTVTHPSLNGNTEMWRFRNNTWDRTMEFDGPVYDITALNLDQVFVGHFNNTKTFNLTGAVMDSVATNNMVLLNTNAPNWYYLTSVDQNLISDTVFAVYNYNSKLYLGGSASDSPGSNGVLLTTYLNGYLQPLITAGSYSAHARINSISIDPTGQGLFCVGKFYGYPNYSQARLIRYSLIGNYWQSIWSDAGEYMAVHCTGQKNELYFGGDFNFEYYGSYLYNIAQMQGYLGIEEDEFESTWTVYPNPFTDQITISNVEADYECQIVNTLGEIVHSGKAEDGRIDELEALPRGTYVLQLFTDEGIRTRKLVK